MPDWDHLREAYRRDGLVVLRGAIREPLLGQLRAESDRARVVARRLHGPQAQRVADVSEVPELDGALLRRVFEVADLRAAVAELLGPDHLSSPVLAVLVEPAEQPWLMGWHRDWLHNTAGVEAEAWWRYATDVSTFNQLNAALHPDRSFWYVPGSHVRRDGAAEQAAHAAPVPEAPVSEEQVLAYMAAMPGSRRLELDSGDIAFYRNSAWHAAAYDPRARRATIHTWYDGPADRRWQAEWRTAAGSSRA